MSKKGYSGHDKLKKDQRRNRLQAASLIAGYNRDAYKREAHYKIAPGHPGKGRS